MQMSRQSKGFRIFKEGPWFLNLTLFSFESVLCLVKPQVLYRHQAHTFNPFSLDLIRGIIDIIKRGLDL
ncbi:hypothetical protein HanPSC8_Chr04g0141051 [Helianthus annuus]|nr:hypothetical protein HanPSC8_Chr04g0141051 [Helianthus annuus]